MLIDLYCENPGEGIPVDLTIGKQIFHQLDEILQGNHQAPAFLLQFKIDGRWLHGCLCMWVDGAK